MSERTIIFCGFIVSFHETCLYFKQWSSMVISWSLNTGPLDWSILHFPTLKLAKSLVKTIGKDPSQHIFLHFFFGVQIKYQTTFWSHTFKPMALKDRTTSTSWSQACQVSMRLTRNLWRHLWTFEDQRIIFHRSMRTKQWKLYWCK